MFVRAYLLASTTERDANRAREQIDAFARDHGLVIAGYYVENESGAKLTRPELFRLLSDATPGDICLVEQVDRLSRLNSADWEKLKAELAARRVRVVALDLPTSWMLAKSNADEFTARMFDALNGMMLDMLAAVARKDEKGFSGEGWHPEEAVSREDALKMFTLWPAHAAFEEKLRGTIEAGKLADFTILSADIMKIPVAEILKTRNVMTVINGEIVYEAKPQKGT